MKSKKHLPPESIYYTGTHDQPTSFTHLQYNQTKYLKHDKIVPLKEHMIDWIVIEGFGSIDSIKNFCLENKVEPMVIEDIFNVQQRNKVEVYESYLFSVHQYSYIDGDTIKKDYISMLKFSDKLVTFSEKNNLFITEIMKRLNSQKSIVRQQNINYLYYLLHDLIVDEGYAVYMYLEKQIDQLETKLLTLDRNDEVLIYTLRRELMYLKNCTSQLHDNLFNSTDVKRVIINPENQKYYDDLKDHLLNLRDRTRFEVDVLNNLYDMHLNNLSHKMNSIMKTLTIFSAIFIPLSFIAGVFGMNFINFPILQNRFGFLYFTILCVLIVGGMILFFKKKKWF